jgi:hypothetical protein
MVNKLIILLFLSVSALFAQDTVYIATVGNNATVTYKSTVQSIPLSSISASKFTGTLQPTRVAIFNGSTQINDWVFNNYNFKVNSTAITNVDSFVPVVNRLNTASIKSFKLIQEIQVVAALPVSPDPNITYLIGAKDTILISGLNGNTDMMYNIVADVLNPTSSDAIIMRINNISTNVYDYRYSVAGAASTVAANAQNSIVLAPTSGSNSISHINIDVDGRTGLNRNIGGILIRGGASQNSIDNNYVIGGNWRDSSTNITSICFRYPSITGGYGVGTTIKVFALRP